MNKNNFEDNVLLKIKRQFTIDESISFLLDTVKKLKFTNGQQKSEIQHLENKITNINNTNIVIVNSNKKYKKELSILKQQKPTPIEVKINEKVIELKKIINDEKNKYFNLNKRHNELLLKYNKLLNKI